MKGIDVKDDMNFAIIGHGGCGKTSLLDAMMYVSGGNDRHGRVDDGSSIGDTSPEEKERNISIQSHPLHTTWDSRSLFSIDTPGYADFMGDVVCGLRVADAAVVVVDAISGVDVGTIRVWKLADYHNLPRIIFINKLDKENTNFQSCLQSVKTSFGERCVPLVVPVGSQASLSAVADVISGKDIDGVDDDLKGFAGGLKEKLIESAAETDDSLVEKYLEGGTLSAEEVAGGLRKAVRGGTLIPVFCGSAEREIGIRELLDGIVKLFPSPEERGCIETEGEAGVKPSKDEPFSAFVFKNVTDPFVGQLTYFRVYSGTLEADSSFYNASTVSSERFGHLYLIKGKDQESVDEAGPGDIVAVPKLKATAVGNSLCSEGEDIRFKPLWLPKPVISFAVYPKKRGDEERIASGLHRLMEEDPTLKAWRNNETGEFILSGMGDLHIETAVQRLRNKFKVDVDLKIPKVPYKETIKVNAEGHERYKKQTGGRGQYAEVYIKLEPMERGQGFEFLNEIVGGAVPRGYLPSVEKGIKNAMAGGVVGGFPVVDLKVRCYDGTYHDVDSSNMAFEIAGSKAFKDGMGKAKPIVLEPIYNVEVVVPADYMGSVTGDLNSKRGRIMGMESVGELQKIKAQVPLAEMLRYCTELRSMTGGRGTFEIEFDHYEEVPGNLLNKILEQSRGKGE